MSTSLVLTVIGNDRPGLVGAISKVISAHEGNWEASHFARLAGRFAGILQVTVAADRADALARDLEKLGPEGLKVTVEGVGEGEEPTGESYWVELVGNDSPNIVREISQALASRNVTVVELSSECTEAAMSGGKLFKMQASIRCPADLSRAELRESLEDIANSFMVDIRLDE